MPIDRKKKVNLHKVTKSLRPMKTERTHEENQERAYIAASRRSDRSLEARVESARRASEIHKKRTGKGFRITEQDVMNEEMYEEEDDDISARAFARGYVLRNMYGSADSRLNDYLNHAFYMGNLVQRSVDEQYSRAFPHAPQFPTNYQPGMQGIPSNGGSPSMSTQYSPIQAIYNPLHAAQFAALQQQQQQQQQAQQQEFPQQYVRAGLNYHQIQQGPTQTQHQIPRFQAPQMTAQVPTPHMQTQGYNHQAHAMLQLTPGLMQHNLSQGFRPQYVNSAAHPLSMKTSPITPQPSPVALPPQIDLGPLSASIPPEAQQFLSPGYNILPIDTCDLKPRIKIDTCDLKRHNPSSAGQNVQIKIKEEPKTPQTSPLEDDVEEQEQLDTPAESPSGTSVPDLADDTSITNNCSPAEMFSPLNTDMVSTSSFSSVSGKETSSLLIPNDNTTSPTEGNPSITGYDDMFAYNYNTNYEWMVNDWTRDAFAM